MRRCRPRQVWLLLAVASFISTQDAAAGFESHAPQCSGVSQAPAGTVAIADCAGLETLPAYLTEDVNLFLDGIRAVTCDKLVTLTVNSGTELALRLGPITCSSSSSSSSDYVDNNEGINDSPGSGSSLRGVRIVVKEGGRLTVGMAVDPLGMEPATAGQGSSTLTWEGATQQRSNGGALEVQRGGTAVFAVPVLFEGNSVAHGFSGGALHADGEVTFKHAAHFEGNRIELGEDLPGQGHQSCGGGVSVGASGRVKFSEFASFEENSAGRGGALCNRGWVRFFRRSFFNANHARGGVTVGGDGGAMCAEEGSQTIFTRKSTILMNWAAGSGGGLFNAGVAIFETSAVFRGNNAAAAVAGEPATAATTVGERGGACLQPGVFEDQGRCLLSGGIQLYRWRRCLHGLWRGHRAWWDNYFRRQYGGRQLRGSLLGCGGYRGKADNYHTDRNDPFSRSTSHNACPGVHRRRIDLGDRGGDKHAFLHHEHNHNHTHSVHRNPATKKSIAPGVERRPDQHLFERLQTREHQHSERWLFHPKSIDPLSAVARDRLCLVLCTNKITNTRGPSGDAFVGLFRCTDGHQRRPALYDSVAKSISSLLSYDWSMWPASTDIQVLVEDFFRVSLCAKVF